MGLTDRALPSGRGLGVLSGRDLGVLPSVRGLGVVLSGRGLGVLPSGRGLRVFPSGRCLGVLPSGRVPETSAYQFHFDVLSVILFHSHLEYNTEKRNRYCNDKHLLSEPVHNKTNFLASLLVKI